MNYFGAGLTGHRLPGKNPVHFSQNSHQNTTTTTTTCVVFRFVTAHFLQLKTIEPRTMDAKSVVETSRPHVDRGHQIAGGLRSTFTHEFVRSKRSELGGNLAGPICQTRAK